MPYFRLHCCFLFTEEISVLTDHLTSEGKSLHELDRARKKAELEREELRAALEEAEGALELEEVILFIETFLKKLQQQQQENLLF